MCIHIYQFSSVQLLSHVRLFATPWTTACQASLSIINSRSLLRLCPLSRCCHPTTSSSVIPFSSRLQSFPASGSFQMSQLFASGGQNIGVSASTSELPMNIQDWLDLPAVQGTLKSLLQHHRSKASILRHSGFFIVQLSYPYMTTGKTTALTGRIHIYMWDFPGGSVVKNLPANAGNTGTIPGFGRSPGGGNGNPLQYSWLENLMDRGAWGPTVHAVIKSRTQLSD